jgi:hypothetical protein
MSLLHRSSPFMKTFGVHGGRTSAHKATVPTAKPAAATANAHHVIARGTVASPARSQPANSPRQRRLLPMDHPSPPPPTPRHAPVRIAAHAATARAKAAIATTATGTAQRTPLLPTANRRHPQATRAARIAAAAIVAAIGATIVVDLQAGVAIAHVAMATATTTAGRR